MDISKINPFAGDTSGYEFPREENGEVIHSPLCKLSPCTCDDLYDLYRKAWELGREWGEYYANVDWEKF